MHCTIYAKNRALRGLYIASGGVFDHFVALAAGIALALRGHGLGILRLQPFDPVGPPAALVFGRARDELLEAEHLRVIGPVLVLLRFGRVDHTGNMPRTREHEFERALEVVRQLKHAPRRGDMVLAPGLNIGRRLHQREIERRPIHAQRVLLHQAVVAIEIAQIGEVPLAGQIGGVAVPIQQVEGRIILAMGRLHRQKGFDILIEAFAALADSSIRLVILGEGEERAALRAQAKNLGVEARVHLPGFDARPERWLAHTDLFVLSSRWEGFGHVLAEAMAAGVPVIAARAPHGPEEIIEDGKTGLLVPVADPVALTQAMARLLDDRDWACRLAAQARIAVERFSLPVIADQYAEQIERVARLRDAAGGHQ